MTLENITLKSEAMLMLCCILDPGSSQEWRQNMIDHCWKGRRKMIAQNCQQSNFWKINLFLSTGWLPKEKNLTKHCAHCFSYFSSFRATRRNLIAGSFSTNHGNGNIISQTLGGNSSKVQKTHFLQTKTETWIHTSSCIFVKYCLNVNPPPSPS